MVDLHPIFNSIPFDFQEILEKKVEYCQHLLRVAKILCPGPSEMRGYLLWEYFGASFRLAQWHWIRMKITTPIYVDMLKKLKSDLDEIVSILGPIRKDSDEGQMGLKARAELKNLVKTIEELEVTFKNSATLQYLPSNKIASRLSSKTLANSRTDTDRILNRRSLCI